jgi:hypothetical protein
LGDDNRRDDGSGHLLALGGRQIRAEVRVCGGYFPDRGDGGIHGFTHGGDNLVG